MASNLTQDHFCAMTSTGEFTTRQAPRLIEELIADYRYFQDLCKRETEDLERLSTSIEQRIQTELDAVHDKSDDTNRWQLANENQAPNGDTTDQLCAVEREKILTRSRAARKFNLPSRVFAGDRFVKGITDLELQELEAYDAQIRLHLFQLSDIETQIMTICPENEGEAFAKLRFLSGLIKENTSVEADVLARAVEDTVGQIEQIIGDRSRAC